MPLSIAHFFCRFCCAAGGCVALFWSVSLHADEMPSSEMERLGRLSGEVLLHASVLKRFDLACPGPAKAPDPLVEMEREVANMPDDFQSAFSLQVSTTVKLGDFIVRDLLKKAGGCGAPEVLKARSQAGTSLEQALRHWRAR